MQVIRNHYKDKPTVFIGNRIINGCQDFTIDQLDNVARKYQATDIQVNQVREMYTHHIRVGDGNIDQMINDTDWYVRAAIARYGNDTHRDQLINDTDSDVRYNVARYGNDTHRDQLINDTCWKVRVAVAHCGNDTHRDQLINDTNWKVRTAVEQGGK